jgi:8-oxo-dGTP pyrophosphatase MutT (NUDIX family)
LANNACGLITAVRLTITGGCGVARAVAATNQILHQAGAIAYRVERGKLEVLLMTSRQTGRWIIPKGNIAPGATPAVAAAREAYEEAGVRGRIDSPIPLGFYNYFKRLASGEARPAAVEVYLLRAEVPLKKWPEKGQRRRSWMSPAKAALLIEEPGAVPLLRRLMEFEAELLGPKVAGVLAKRRRRPHGARRL